MTGVTPGAYVWRICIALHSTPRFAVGFMHYNNYKNRIQYINEKYRGLYQILIRINFWIYAIENFCLVAVTFISNKENYRKYIYIYINMKLKENLNRDISQ